MKSTDQKLRIGWMSHHVEGIAPLQALLAASIPISCILTLESDLLATKSGAVDYEGLASRYAIPLYRIRNVNSPASLDLLEKLCLDILFVIGWSQILHRPVLDLVRIGCFGAHASLLPANRGSAPINWALINGETQTGNTLMKLSPEIDGGDIVAQRAFKISPFDTVKTLYDRVGQTNSEMLVDLAARLLSGAAIDAKPQVADGSPLLPRRRPEDGLIDWNKSAQEIYNFVRALTRPYPGAFSFVNEQRYLIWRTALLPLQKVLASPGTVLGPVLSSDEENCGQLVACGCGAIVLLEIEPGDGGSVSGRALAERRFEKNWSSGEGNLG